MNTGNLCWNMLGLNFLAGFSLSIHLLDFRIKTTEGIFWLACVHRLLYRNTIYFHLLHERIMNNTVCLRVSDLVNWIQFYFLKSLAYRPTKWSIQCDKMIRPIKIDLSPLRFVKRKGHTYLRVPFVRITNLNCQCYRILLYSSLLNPLGIQHFINHFRFSHAHKENPIE